MALREQLQILEIQVGLQLEEHSIRPSSCRRLVKVRCVWELLQKEKQQQLRLGGIQEMN